jgi:hypothetical protein
MPTYRHAARHALAPLAHRHCEIVDAIERLLNGAQVLFGRYYECDRLVPVSGVRPRSAGLRYERIHENAGVSPHLGLACAEDESR